MLQSTNHPVGALLFKAPSFFSPLLPAEKNVKKCAFSHGGASSS